MTAVTRAGRPLPAWLQSRGVSRVDGSNKSRTEIIKDLGEPVDALIDPTSYDADSAEDLLGAEAQVGAYVVLSSSSVYADEEGRSLDEARETGFPNLPVGISEDTATVAPGPATYSTRKVAMEHRLQQASRPVIILRPCAVYGRMARALREAWVLKRVFDDRPLIPLARNGESVFHTSSCEGIASLIAQVLESPFSATLNVADPTPLRVLDIVRALEAAIDQPIPLHFIDGVRDDFVGSTPWSVPQPYVLDVSRARATGWDGGPDYSDAIRDVCHWATSVTARVSWDEVFPLSDIYGMNVFNYTAEDRFFAEISL